MSVHYFQMDFFQYLAMLADAECERNNLKTKNSIQCIDRLSE